jgi:hypothetical protein
MPWLKCTVCSADFYAKPSHIKVGWGKYCSNVCYYKAAFTGKTVSCDTCAKKVYKTQRALRNSKSKKYFCDKSCFAVWKNKNILTGVNNAHWKHGENAYRAIMLRNKAPIVCQGCAINDIRILVVHHIDQDRHNNELANLKWLCRNCHYLEHNGKTF